MMKRIGKQKTSSLNPSSTQKKKKNNFEQQPFTVPATHAPVTDPNIDLSGYRPPLPEDMIANVMRSIEAGTANKPAFNHKRQGNELTAPPRQNYQPIINPVRKLTAPRQDSNGKGQIVQPKLTIGRPNDKYEQEADRVAAQVVQQINRPAPMSRLQGGMVQGKEEEEGLRMKPMPKISEIEAMPEEGQFLQKEKVQRREAIGGGEASAELSGEINRARGGGQPLDAGLQQSMGRAMGADFSEVGVHTDERADRLNRSLSSRAFTMGQDLFFKKGEYQPGNREGQGLIAHELVHVVQQIVQYSKDNEEKVQRRYQVIGHNILPEDKKIYDESYGANRVYNKYEDDQKARDKIKPIVRVAMKSSTRAMKLFIELKLNPQFNFDIRVASYYDLKTDKNLGIPNNLYSRKWGVLFNPDIEQIRGHDNVQALIHEMGHAYQHMIGGKDFEILDQLHVEAEDEKQNEFYDLKKLKESANMLKELANLYYNDNFSASQRNLPRREAYHVEPTPEDEYNEEKAQSPLHKLFMGISLRIKEREREGMELIWDVLNEAKGEAYTDCHTMLILPDDVYAAESSEQAKKWFNAARSFLIKMNEEYEQWLYEEAIG